MLTKPLKQLFDSSEYVLNPNLPDNKVSLVAISKLAGEAIKKLSVMDIECFPVEADLRLPEQINSHADIQLLHMGKNTVFCHKEHLFRGGLKKNLTLRKSPRFAQINIPKMFF